MLPPEILVQEILVSLANKYIYILESCLDDFVHELVLGSLDYLISNIRQSLRTFTDLQI